MAYGDFKNLTRRRAFAKILRDKAFNIAKNHKYDGYQCKLASMVYNFFDKKSSSLARSEILATRDKYASGRAIKNKIMSNKELAKDLQKSIIRNLFLKKVYSSFMNYI